LIFPKPFFEALLTWLIDLGFNPNNFALLKKNTELNGYQNVVLENKTVSDRTQKLGLYLSPTTPADHKIYDSSNSRKFIEVEGVSLNDYFKNYNRKTDFIMIDVQGSESVTIQGMSLLLQKTKKLKMLSEFLSYGLTQFGIEPKDYLQLLKV
jgi:FkbM family methyltransferase